MAMGMGRGRKGALWKGEVAQENDGAYLGVPPQGAPHAPQLPPIKVLHLIVHFFVSSRPRSFAQRIRDQQVIRSVIR